MKKLYFLAGALILASAPFVFGAVDLTRVMQVIMLDGVSGTPISSSNPLPVTAGSASASAGQYADDADFTDGTSVGVLGQAVAESASPTAVTEGDVGALAMTLNRALKSSLYTPLGDSAMDDTVNAVVTKAYVTENDAPSGTPVTVGAAATTVVNIDLGAVNGGRVLCDLENDDTENNRTINAVDIYVGAATSVNGTSSTITLSEVDFSNPPSGGPLRWATTGAAGADRDATPDTSLDEDDHLKLYFDNLAGADNLTIQMTASGAGASVIPYCKTAF